MKSLAAVAIYILTLTTPAAIAGVILEIANKDMVCGGLDATKIHADSGRIRMDPATSEGAPESSMIFRDNEFLILNHSDKSYTVIDKLADECRHEANARTARKHAARATRNGRTHDERTNEGIYPGRSATGTGIQGEENRLRQVAYVQMHPVHRKRRHAKAAGNLCRIARPNRRD